MATKTEKRPATELEKTTPRRLTTAFEEMDAVFDRVFDEFATRGWLRPFQFGRPWWTAETEMELRSPQVDVLERDEEVLVRAELPGVTKKDLQVSLTEDTLTLKAETRREKREEEENYFRREIAHGSFSRTVRLPCAVKGDEAEAHFKDGVLAITLPKVTKAKRQTVEVK